MQLKKKNNPDFKKRISFLLVSEVTHLHTIENLGLCHIKC